MYQNGQRDPSRPYQLPPPPPPPMSPPMRQQMGNMGTFPPPPPPPRYQAAGQPAPGGMAPPPPPGPPPANNAPWPNVMPRMYDGRAGVGMPPPPGPVQAYNPRLHGQIPTGSTISIPLPPPPTEGMSATYIPQGDTYGEGVGIPGFGLEDANNPYSNHSSQPPWTGMPQNSADPAAANSMDESVNRDRLHASPMATRGLSNASSASGLSTQSATPTAIPVELAAQWPMERVLAWLQANSFSRDWQETFKALNLCGMHFLDLSSLRTGRGNSGLMHQQVYPRLAMQCSSSGTGWNQDAERLEGKRMRRAIRTIVRGDHLDTSKIAAGEAESPNVCLGHCCFWRNRPLI